jgi:hypothetical protein
VRRVRGQADPDVGRQIVVQLPGPGLGEPQHRAGFGGIPGQELVATAAASPERASAPGGQAVRTSPTATVPEATSPSIAAWAGPDHIRRSAARAA